MPEVSDETKAKLEQWQYDAVWNCTMPPECTPWENPAVRPPPSKKELEKAERVRRHTIKLAAKKKKATKKEKRAAASQKRGDDRAKHKERLMALGTWEAYKGNRNKLQVDRRHLSKGKADVAEELREEEKHKTSLKWLNGVTATMQEELDELNVIEAQRAADIAALEDLLN